MLNECWEQKLFVYSLHVGLPEKELYVANDENAFVQLLAEKDIHIIGMGGGKLRMVTHLDYTDVMHDKLMSSLRGM